MSRELEIIGAGAASELAGPVPERPGEGPKHAVAHTECLNCGTPLHGRFCHACGQTADDHHRSIFHLVWEAVEGFTHLDGRLAKTLPPLFFFPGRLARDHFEGRRQRHVPPFRLFLVALLLFMLALESVMHHAGGHAPGTAGGEHGAAPAPVVTVNADGSKHYAVRPTAEQLTRWSTGRVNPDDINRELRGEKPLAPDAVVDGVPPPQPPAAPQVTAPANIVPGDDRLEAEKVGNWFSERLKKAMDNPEYYKSIVFQWAHRLAVVLLPIFALQLTILFFYKRRYYVYDHLVVSMQFLSFVFLISAAAWILPNPVRDVAVFAASVWTPVNLFLLLRGAYGSSVIGALLKTFYLWFSTLVTFSLLLIALLALGLQQL